MLDAICAQLGRAAAMLDGELPPEVAGDVAAPAWTCFPAQARLGPAAPAPTTPTHASTRRRSATWSPTPWTRIRSWSCCCGAGPGAKCWPGCGPGAAARDQAPGRAERRARTGRRAGRAVAWAPDGRAVGAHQWSGADGADRAWMRGPRCTSTVRPDPGPAAAAARPGHPAALPVDPPAWRAGLRDDLLALAADAASGPGNWPSASTPTLGWSLTQTPIWPAVPRGRSAHQPSPRSPNAAASAGGNWPAGAGLALRRLVRARATAQRVGSRHRIGRGGGVAEGGAHNLE